jgi:hypothetical protein
LEVERKEERERERESPSLHFEVATLLIEKGIPLE